MCDGLVVENLDASRRSGWKKPKIIDKLRINDVVGTWATGCETSHLRTRPGTISSDHCSPIGKFILASI